MHLGQPRHRMAEMNVALAAKQDLAGLGIVQHGEGGVFLRQALQGAGEADIILAVLIDDGERIDRRGRRREGQGGRRPGGRQRRAGRDRVEPAEGDHLAGAGLGDLGGLAGGKAGDAADPRAVDGRAILQRAAPDPGEGEPPAMAGMQRAEHLGERLALGLDTTTRGGLGRVRGRGAAPSTAASRHAGVGAAEQHGVEAAGRHIGMQRR